MPTTLVSPSPQSGSTLEIGIVKSKNYLPAGVLQVEAMAQLGGICMLDPEGPSKDQFFFGGIEKCRFKKPVVPGDTLVRQLLFVAPGNDRTLSCLVQKTAQMRL